ncbi:MAG: radical SAM protein [Xenococcaceae cyanobacterium]
MIFFQKFGSVEISSKNVRSLLNKATGFINSYDFTLNPYQGCQFGCSYCYAAAFNTDVQMRQNWGNWVIIKANAREILEKELSQWQKKNPEIPPSIYMSSVTDPYQPIEAKQKLTRSLLEVMLRYQPTLVIQTRSPMVVRDIDLLRQFQRLRVNMSVPTGSESVRKDFEGRSPSIKSRLYAIGTLKHAIAWTETHQAQFSATITPLLPIIPADEIAFIEKLRVVDRVVIQPFHPSNQKTLVASTRSEAIAIESKYKWWYDNERQSYQGFKEKLFKLLDGVEIKEGKEGFSYD